VEFLGRIDDSDDELFYVAPRRVVPIDNGVIAEPAKRSCGDHEATMATSLRPR
jgi:hypothetical protein